jgi:hypothetical protein
MNENKCSFKLRSWNKKIKRKNTMCAQCECKRILLQNYNEKKKQRYIRKINVDKFNVMWDFK